MINNMCLTWRHDFGLLNEQEQNALRSNMEQLVYHCIEPKLKEEYENGFNHAVEIIRNFGVSHSVVKRIEKQFEDEKNKKT